MRNHIAVIYSRSIHDVSPMAKAFEKSGFDVQTIHDCESLYQITQRQQVDVIVIEHKLDSFLTGLEILSRLNEALVRPTTVLLGVLSDREKTAAKAANVDYVFPFEHPPGEIAEACLRSCKWEANRGVFIPETARNLVRDADFLQPLPQLAIKILPYLRDETANVADLANEISKDALATAEILRVINSSSSGVRNRVHRLTDAVSLLGIKQTVTTILRFCIQASQENLATRLDPDLLAWFSTRSTLTASTASVLAKRSGEICPDTVYLLGLLQDLGVLALAHEYEGYFKLIQRYQKIPQVRLEMLEDEEYEMNHAHVSAAIMQRWQMPASIIRLVLHHHTALADFDDLSKMESGVIQTLQVGETLANMQDYPSAYRFQRFAAQLDALPNRDSLDIKGFLSESISKACESAELHKTPAPDPKKWGLFVDAINGYLDPSQKRAPEPPQQPVLGANDSRKPQLLVFDNNAALADDVEALIDDDSIQVRRLRYPEGELSPPANVCGVVCEASFHQGEAIRLVREFRRQDANLPIIVVSRNRTRSAITKLIQAGITGFLASPYTESQLREKLLRRKVMKRPLPSSATAVTQTATAAAPA